MKNILPYKILLVDDDEENISTLSAVLKDSGYSTDSANSGKKALELLRKRKYGLLILDVQMPEMKRFELIEIIKGNKQNKDIPLIFLSADSNDKEYFERRHNVSALDYLISPIDKTILLLKAKNLLQLHHSRILLEKSKKIPEKKAEHALKKSESQIRNFANYLSNTLEDQRKILAKEIHDELAPRLAGIKFGISSLKKTIPGHVEFENKIVNIISDVDLTIQNLRRIATALRPGILDALGLAASIDWLVKEFNKKTNIPYKIEFDTEGYTFDKNTATCFFRICEEALTNISKHAEATEINVHLYVEEGFLILTIKDNAKGMTKNKQEKAFSMGILAMKERVNSIGGTFEIYSNPQKGTSIKIFVKLKLLKNEKNPNMRRSSSNAKRNSIHP